MARTTINLNSKNLARDLRSLAAKIDADSLTPGADLKIGNARVQVAQVQESDVRAFARAQGLPVGSRGRISAEVQAAFAAHKKAERKAKREAQAARKAERESVEA
jgi:hypothetical protein